MREGAGVQKAATTELARRVNVSGDMGQLEQENIRLRARIHKLEERLAKIEETQPRDRENKSKARKEILKDTKEQKICLSPMKIKEETYRVMTKAMHKEEERSAIAEEGNRGRPS
ncbi:hypothetical protein QLX08_009358 [Tetragonisca angustula]|uniref:Uncharacterized protein n=1 Tax=Tetragonisca angustula TaxID=166442 RepID=A0AAW0ZGB1_9HYME